MHTLVFLTPSLVAHAACAFYFAYVFQYSQRAEPSCLELVRMVLVCLPVIVATVGAWQAKREDVRMNSGLEATSQDDQRHYVLERRSIEADSVPAYDAFGQKVAGVFETSVVASPRDRMWAPHGQSWSSEQHAYQDMPLAIGRQGM